MSVILRLQLISQLLLKSHWIQSGKKINQMIAVLYFSHTLMIAQWIFQTTKYGFIDVCI